ncbi:MAG: hypothetical protein EB084_25450 [Proteobacteria bacterium]|jgi:hypothetical protein|nr:hypothetical protein [Pseudomonadota bacterium]
MKHGDLVLIAYELTPTGVNELGLYLGERKCKWDKKGEFLIHGFLINERVVEFRTRIEHEKYLFEVIS